jgi:ABC-2 type transport system permease protein/oleandomycin transport system permease protein
MNTAQTAIPDRSRLTLAETLADSRVMAARQLRKVSRRPMYVGYLFVQPVIFVLLFRYVFGEAINTGRVSYVDYLMPGIIVMTAIFGLRPASASPKTWRLERSIVFAHCRSPAQPC